MSMTNKNDIDFVIPILANDLDDMKKQFYKLRKIESKLGKISTPIVDEHYDNLLSKWESYINFGGSDFNWYLTTPVCELLLKKRVIFMESY